MRTATLRLGLWVAALAVLATPAWAQSNVTFQVDMTTALERCIFDPDDVTITVRGSFNDWGAQDEDYTLSDEDGNGVYTGTFEVENGTINYKFWGSGDIAWEDDPNRTAEITGDVTLNVVAFNKTFPDQCEGPNYLLFFEVDMSIQEALGRFDPDEDALYVQGSFQGWNNLNENWRLSQNPFDPDKFTGEFQVALEPGTTYNYKFAFEDPDGADTWESGADRQFTATGEEEIDSETGLRLITITRYFDDITPADVLEEPATVRFEVDLRAAYYHLMDNDFLPADTQTGEPVTSINGLFVNGPIAAASLEDNATDWATWGPEALGAIETRRLYDDGTNTDRVAADSVYTRTYTYPAGTPRLLIGKFGIGGYDNEGGFGADHHFRIAPGEQTLEINFGCIVRRDGTFTDTSGPTIGDQDFSEAYSPYLIVDNEAEPPSCTVVRAGGATGVEPTGRAPEGFVLKGNFPNPAVASTTFEYGLPQASHVRLEVYDLMGRRVATLVDDVQAADTYRVSFDVGALAPGTYFYRLSAGQQSATQRMTVIR